MEKLKYDEVIVEKGTMAVNQADLQLKVKGNNSYKTLNGFMILVKKVSDGSLYPNVNVGLATSQGDIVLPQQPYDAIRPSFQEKFEDRIIKTENLKGSGRDFNFRVEAGVNEVLNVTVIAYFERNK